MKTQVYAAMRSRSGERLITAAVTAVLLAGAAPAHASHGDTHSVVVHVDDLDLATPTGLIELNDRIGRAADRVCKAAVAHTPLATSAIRRCARRVVYAQRGKVRRLVLAAESRNYARFAAGRIAIAAS